VRFLGVVGYVPSRTFELDGRRGDDLFDGAAAFRALFHRLVGEFLDFFKAMTALLALIFVKGHGCETVVRKLFHIDSRGEGSLASIFVAEEKLQPQRALRCTKELRSTRRLGDRSGSL